MQDSYFGVEVSAEPPHEMIGVVASCIGAPYCNLPEVDICRYMKLVDAKVAAQG